MSTSADYRNTKEYREKLHRGFFNINSPKTNYELPNYLPPITDFVYDVQSDKWVRNEAEFCGVSSKYNIPNMQLVVNTRIWNNYNKVCLHKTKQNYEIQPDKTGFLLNDKGERILDVLPLKDEDKTNYISTTYSCGILDAIMSYCITSRIYYLRLRLVCRKFKSVIDTSVVLIPNLSAIVKVMDNKYSDIEYCIFSFPYNLVEAIITTISSIRNCDIDECKCDDFSKLEKLIDNVSERNIRQHYLISNKIIYYITRKGIPITLKWTRLISRLCLILLFGMDIVYQY